MLPVDANLLSKVVAVENAASVVADLGQLGLYQGARDIILPKLSLITGRRVSVRKIADMLLLLCDVHEEEFPQEAKTGALNIQLPLIGYVLVKNKVLGAELSVHISNELLRRLVSYRSSASRERLRILLDELRAEAEMQPQ